MSMIRNFALIVLSVLAFQSVSHAETPAGKQAGHRTELTQLSVDTKNTTGNVLTTVDTKLPNTSKSVLLMAANNTTVPPFLASTEYNEQRRLAALYKPERRVDVSTAEIQCLAKNIYYESGNQPLEGKVAVGLVTLNRKNDKRFPSTVCGVVNQRTRSVCQFSWRCSNVRAPDMNGAQWRESHRIALVLLTIPDTYQNFKRKYTDALYFHATYVRPSWSRVKERVATVGGHLFYRD